MPGASGQPHTVVRNAGHFLQEDEGVELADFSVGEPDFPTPAMVVDEGVRALRAGMTPILNALMVVGIVSLPGMMTGQILAGSPPLEAAKYQIMILLLIAAGTGLGAIFAVWIGSRRLFDERQRLRLDRVLQGALMQLLVALVVGLAPGAHGVVVAGLPGHPDLPTPLPPTPRRPGRGPARPVSAG